MLGPNEKIFGVFRHSGSVGLTKVTFDRPWVADLLVKAFAMKCPEAEFTSVYVSVNSQRDLHVDSNNTAGKSGKNNYIYPIVMPRRGGDLSIEISDGDVVRGKVTEMMDQRGNWESALWMCISFEAGTYHCFQSPQTPCSSSVEGFEDSHCGVHHWSPSELARSGPGDCQRDRVSDPDSCAMTVCPQP